MRTDSIDKEEFIIMSKRRESKFFEKNIDAWLNKGYSHEKSDEFSTEIFDCANISEFESEAEMKEKLELGKSYNFKINLFEPENERLILLYQE